MLQWLDKSSSDFKTYAENRIASIQVKSEKLKVKWNWITGLQNTANAGFGFTGIKEVLASHSLRSLETSVINFEKCNELYSYYTIQIPPGNICTLDRQKGRDACASILIFRIYSKLYVHIYTTNGNRSTRTATLNRPNRFKNHSFHSVARN